MSCEFNKNRIRVLLYSMIFDEKTQEETLGNSTESPGICQVLSKEFSKISNSKQKKLSLYTIARECKLWYHVGIQVDYAYSTTLGMMR